MPGCRAHPAGRAVPPSAQTHYNRSSKELAREEVATAPGIRGKKQQMNLAQGPGEEGLGSECSGDRWRGSRLWSGVETVVVAAWAQHLGEEQRSGPSLAAPVPAWLPPDGAVPAARA